MRKPSRLLLCETFDRELAVNELLLELLEEDVSIITEALPLRFVLGHAYPLRSSLLAFFFLCCSPHGRNLGFVCFRHRKIVVGKLPKGKVETRAELVVRAGRRECIGRGTHPRISIALAGPMTFTASKSSSSSGTHGLSVCVWVISVEPESTSMGADSTAPSFEGFVEIASDELVEPVTGDSTRELDVLGSRLAISALSLFSASSLAIRSSSACFKALAYGTWVSIAKMQRRQ